MSHTPKPWRVEIDDGEYLIKSGENHLIAIIEGMVGEYEPDEYDAHLMKASPDLLEALQFAKSLLEASILWTSYVDERISPAIARAAPPDDMEEERG